MVMMSAKEASTLWGISTRRVTTLCSAGKIPGASKENGSWQIPANAEKPADARVRTGAYKKSAMPAHLPLPVGISDYRLASTEYYYVDKTLMIKDFLEQRPMVSLFTRPRRFGKTLNMDMLRVFFERPRKTPLILYQQSHLGLRAEISGLPRKVSCHLPDVQRRQAEYMGRNIRPPYPIDW